MSEQFTAENTALLLIDHQVGTMQLIKTVSYTHLTLPTKA